MVNAQEHNARVREYVIRQGIATGFATAVGTLLYRISVGYKEGDYAVALMFGTIVGSAVYSILLWRMEGREIFAEVPHAYKKEPVAVQTMAFDSGNRNTIFASPTPVYASNTARRAVYNRDDLVAFADALNDGSLTEPISERKLDDIGISRFGKCTEEKFKNTPIYGMTRAKALMQELVLHGALSESGMVNEAHSVWDEVG